MKERHEFRIFDDYYHLLSKPNNAKFNGAVYILNISKDDPLFLEIGNIQIEFIKNKRGFALYGGAKRSYTTKELSDAELFLFTIKTAFEPEGEDCGTVYDETVACEICGTDRKQIGPLKLRKSSIPKKDIARTIAGEVVVTEKFANACKERKLKGIMFEPVIFNKTVSNYYQPKASSELELSKNTIAGNDPFRTTASSEGGVFTIPGGFTIVHEREVYICPKGHLIGLNLLSEAYVMDNPFIYENDFFVSRQKIGAKIGVFRPEPLYFCSPAFRQMVIEEKLSGFEFEVAHIEKRNERNTRIQN